MALTVTAYGSTDDFWLSHCHGHEVYFLSVFWNRPLQSLQFPCIYHAALWSLQLLGLTMSWRTNTHAVRLCRIPKFHSHRAMTKALGPRVHLPRRWPQPTEGQVSPPWIFGPPVFLGWFPLLSYFIRRPWNAYFTVWISVTLVKDVHRGMLHSSGSSSSWVGKGSPRTVSSWPFAALSHPVQRGHQTEYVQRKQMHCPYTNNSAILIEEHS